MRELPFLRDIKRLAPHWQILAALVLSSMVALVFRSLANGAGEGARVMGFIGGAVSTCQFIGDLFMRALKMLIVPLIVTSVISGITSLQGVKGFGRLGAKTAAFYLSTGTVAILIGLTLVNLIRPGLTDGQPNELIREAFDRSGETAGTAAVETVSVAGTREPTDFLGVFKMMLPENIVAAAGDNGGMLGVIVFSILFGIAITRLPGEQVRTVRDFFQAACDAMIILTKWVMALAPIGVFTLILPVVYSTGAELFANMGKYFATVLAALLIHLVVVLPLVLHFVGRVNPWAHFQAMRPALLLAFSTASSSGSLPVTIRCVEEGSGVSRRVSSFVLPLGSSVNTDGTALYECVAVLFVAQVMGIQLGFGGQLFVVVASLLTCIGMAGIPSASLVAILLILKSSGIPGAETAVVALLSVDRLLDMSRTAVNVYSDSCAAVIVAKTEGESLKV